MTCSGRLALEAPQKGEWDQFPIYFNNMLKQYSICVIRAERPTDLHRFDDSGR
jgi:hypothetical protein